MEFRAHRNDLVRELSLAQGIVERKNTIPILSNVLLSARDGHLELASTDLEIGLTNRFPATIVRPGSFTVSAKKLFEIVRALPADEVSVTLAEGGRLRLRCGAADFRIVGLDPADFPSLPSCDFAASFELPVSIIARLISKVLFAVTVDESRFPLGGALFVGRESGVLLIATDGHRLALAEAACEMKRLASEARFIIPKKALVELRKVMDLGGDGVSIEARENHMFFRVGDRTLISRAVEDQFPNYEKVVPANNDKKVSFSRPDFEGALRRVALLAPEKAGAVNLSFSAGRLIVSCSNPELGEAKEELSCDFTGEELSIGFNAQYLLDFFGVLEADRLTIELKDGVTQGLLKPEGPEQEVSHQYVIMPMRI